jgi:hypothetical protein
MKRALILTILASSVTPTGAGVENAPDVRREAAPHERNADTSLISNAQDRFGRRSTASSARSLTNAPPATATGSIPVEPEERRNSSDATEESRATTR